MFVHADRHVILRLSSFSFFYCNVSIYQVVECNCLKCVIQCWKFFSFIHNTSTRQVVGETMLSFLNEHIMFVGLVIV